MSDDTDKFAVADHFFKVVFNRLFAQIVGPFLGSLGKCLLLARMPWIINGKCWSKRNKEN